MVISGFWDWVIVTITMLIIPGMMGAFFYHLYLDWKYVGDDELMQTIKAVLCSDCGAVVKPTYTNVLPICGDCEMAMGIDKPTFVGTVRGVDEYVTGGFTNGKYPNTILPAPEQREKAEKIVRDSMPQAVKDIVDGVYWLGKGEKPTPRTSGMSLDDWISLHKLDIDAVILKYIPNFTPDNYNLDEERRMWVLYQPSLKKWAVSDGVVI